MEILLKLKQQMELKLEKCNQNVYKNNNEQHYNVMDYETHAIPYKGTALLLHFITQFLTA